MASVTVALMVAGNVPRMVRLSASEKSVSQPLAQ
jgi:hypothetical protein